MVITQWAKKCLFNIFYCEPTVQKKSVYPIFFLWIFSSQPKVTHDPFIMLNEFILLRITKYSEYLLCIFLSTNVTHCIDCIVGKCSVHTPNCVIHADCGIFYGLYKGDTRIYQKIAGGPRHATKSNIMLFYTMH